MPNEALKNRFEAVLREFYAADDAEFLAGLHDKWHDHFIAKIKSSTKVEQSGASLAKKLAALRQEKRVELTRQQREAIGREAVEFMESIWPQLVSMRQIVSACSVTGCSRAQIERVVRGMLRKGVVTCTQPESFFAKTYRLHTFDERVAFLARKEQASDAEGEEPEEDPQDL